MPAVVTVRRIVQRLARACCAVLSATAVAAAIDGGVQAAGRCTSRGADDGQGEQLARRARPLATVQRTRRSHVVGCEMSTWFCVRARGASPSAPRPWAALCTLGRALTEPLSADSRSAEFRGCRKSSQAQCIHRLSTKNSTLQALRFGADARHSIATRRRRASRQRRRARQTGRGPHWPLREGEGGSGAQHHAVLSAQRWRAASTGAGCAGHADTRRRHACTRGQGR